MCILGLKGLSLIAFFLPDVMYGTSDFLNLIVLVGNYAFQQWCQIEFSKNGIYHPVCQRYPWYSMDHRLDPQ